MTGPSNISSTSTLTWEEKKTTSRTRFRIGPPLVVTWGGLSDPHNPRNWSRMRKWAVVLLITVHGTLSPIASTVLAAAAPELAHEFRLRDACSPLLPTALYVLGLAAGPMLLAPCSEILGRKPMYLGSAAAFAALNAGCALAPNVWALSALRLAAGAVGAAGTSLGGPSIGDMFSQPERGRAHAIYGLGPTAGPVIGGVVGGFVAYHQSWRWLMWGLTGAAALAAGASAIFQQETYAAVLLQRHIKQLRKEYPKLVFRPEFEIEAREVLGRALSAPFRLLARSPTCFFMSLYLATLQGVFFLHLTTLPLLYSPLRPILPTALPTYAFPHGLAGLPYLAPGLGTLFGTLIAALLLDRSYVLAANRHRRRASRATVSAAFRLPFVLLVAAIMPGGLAAFGWAAVGMLPRAHWMLPLVGSVLIGTGMVASYVGGHAYLVESFGSWARGALAAAALLRAIITAALVVLGWEVYAKLGYAWGSMLLAGLCLVAQLIPAALLVRNRRRQPLLGGR